MVISLLVEINFLLKWEGTTFLVPSMCQALCLGHTKMNCPLAFLFSFWCCCALLECITLGLKVALFFNAMLTLHIRWGLEAEL